MLSFHIRNIVDTNYKIDTKSGLVGLGKRWSRNLSIFDGGDLCRAPIRSLFYKSRNISWTGKFFQG